MISLELDRSVARRRTRVALGVAVGLLALGVWYGAWALAGERARPSAASILAGAAADVPRPAPLRAVSANVDAWAVGLNLGRIGNRPVPPASPAPGGVNGSASTPTEPALAVRFLGVIAEPERLLALVHAGGRQRVVGVGAMVPADAEGSRLVRIRSVTREALVLADGEKEIRLERAARTGPAVTYVAGTSPSASGGVGQPYAPGSTGYVPAGVTGVSSGRVTPMSGLDRMREMQRRLGVQRDLVSGIPDMRMMSGDSVGTSEADGEPLVPPGVPKAVPVTPDGTKPQ